MPQAETGARPRADQSSPHPTETHRAKSSLGQTWPGGGKTALDKSNHCKTHVFLTNTIWIYFPHPHHGLVRIFPMAWASGGRASVPGGGNFAKARRTTAPPQASPEPTYLQHVAPSNCA